MLRKTALRKNFTLALMTTTLALSIACANAQQIVVDRAHHRLSYEGHSWPVAVGKRFTATPAMTTYVARKAEHPSWNPPPDIQAKSHAPAHVPPGPHNPLGTRALYLGNSLYRIHGTNQPWLIGRSVSHGCIRMRNHDVEQLYSMVPVGTPVVIK